MKTYYVYVLASCKNGTLYIGVTDNLQRRIRQHKDHLNPSSFTAKYDVDQLVYYESTNEIEVALQREKQLKHWNRQWKLVLIEHVNPNWRDLAEDFV